MAFPLLSRDHIRKILLETFNQAGIARAGVYLQISRGAAPRNHAYPADAKPRIVVTVRPVPEMSAQLRTDGARTITVPDIRWGRCDIKSVQLVPNTMAKQQAIEAGVDDAIFVGQESIVREGTASNVFMVKNGQLATHPLTTHILPGITRALILIFCEQQNLSVSERFFNKTALLDADEVFLTGTVTEVLSVVQVDGQTIGRGRPGPVAMRLFDLLRERAEA